MPIDYSRYPPNWKTEIVPRIRFRSGGKCENCGVPNGARLWSVPLKIYLSGRYQVRRVWVEGGPTLKRMEQVAYQPTPSHAIRQVRVVLTVAHLDHDEENHNVSDDRLADLCQYCHLNYDAKEKYRRACARSKS